MCIKQNLTLLPDVVHKHFIFQCHLFSALKEKRWVIFRSAQHTIKCTHKNIQMKLKLLNIQKKRKEKKSGLLMVYDGGCQCKSVSWTRWMIGEVDDRERSVTSVLFVWHGRCWRWIPNVYFKGAGDRGCVCLCAREFVYHGAGERMSVCVRSLRWVVRRVTGNRRCVYVCAPR